MSGFPAINDKYRYDRYVNVELTSNTVTFYRILNKSQYSDNTRKMISEEKNEEYPEFKQTYDNSNTVIPGLYDSSSNSGDPVSKQSPRGKLPRPDADADADAYSHPDTGRGKRTRY